VVEAKTQAGGFSPGVAARLDLGDGRRAFVKAVSEATNPESPTFHRREARILASLPASVPVPRLLALYDQAGWVALLIEDVDGRHPGEPWTEPDVSLVVGALTELARSLTPPPLTVGATAADALAREICGWAIALGRRETRLSRWCLRNLERLAALEAEAPSAASGNTQLHFDTRADNLLVAQGRVFVVDWPHARVGAPFVDWLAMAPSVEMQGGPAAKEFFARFDTAGVPDRAIEAVLCSVAGYFVVRALDPPPPGIPTLRAFQAAQGRAAVGWLRELTGWE